MASSKGIAEDYGKNYNPASRRAGVMDCLWKKLQQIKSYVVGGKFPAQENVPEQRNRVPEKSKSIHMLKLESMTSKLGEISERVKQFDGPHFTKEYRSIQEACTQHELRLDEFDYAQVDTVRSARKDALIRVQNLSKELNAKTHPDGKPCPDCELQNHI